MKAFIDRYVQDNILQPLLRSVIMIVLVHFEINNVNIEFKNMLRNVDILLSRDGSRSVNKQREHLNNNVDT